MKVDITKFIVMAVIFTLLDSLYLTSATPHFSELILRIQKSPLRMDLLATVLCYVALLFGLYYFIIQDNKSVTDAAILGLVIYSIYELTNKAIFINWTWFTVLLDTVWGGILFSLTTYLVYKIYGKI